MNAKFDKDVCVITFVAAFALCGAALLTPVDSARAADNARPVTMASTVQSTSSTPATNIGSVESTPANAVVDEDGDGNELMEHWSDPKDIHEQHYQLAGMLVIFLLTAGVAVRQKIALRRLTRG